MSMARPSSRPCSVEQRDARACAADVAGVIWEQKEEKGDSVDSCAGSVSEQGSAEPRELPLQSPQQATPSGQRPSQAAQLAAQLAAPRQLGSLLPPARWVASGWVQI